MQGGKREKSNMKKFKRIAIVGHISSTSWSPFYAYYMSFRSSGSQESNASNNAWIEVAMKKLWSFEDNRIKLCENFAAAKWVAKISQPKAHFAATKWAMKCPFGTQAPFRSPILPFCSCEMACENAPWMRNWTTLWNHLQATNQVANHLQVVKSPPSCEITNSTCKIRVQTCKMDNSTCESPCEIHLCKLKYLQLT